MWMLQRDDHLRLSDEYQQMYNQTHHPNEAIPIIEKIQNQVIDEAFELFSIDQTCISKAEVKIVLNSVLQLYPNDREIKSCAHYLKYNRMFDCHPLLENQVFDAAILDALVYENQKFIPPQDSVEWIFMTGSLS